MMRVTTARQLLAAQAARFGALDPLLPRAGSIPHGRVLTAVLPDGRRVAGVLLTASYPPGSLPSLWSARDVRELVPLVGAAGGCGLDALLHAWRELQERDGVPPADSAAVVTWPSRDVEATRVLLDHGFVPLSVLAVRCPGTPPPPASGQRGNGPPTARIRRATPRDLDTVHELAMFELQYSALVGSATLRDDAAELKRGSLRARLLRQDPVWLAELDGVAVALAECSWTEPDPESWAVRLPPGRWGYVNCVSVRPEVRGTGVGRQLMDRVHDEFHREGSVGTYLYYNPPNPLSSVFWPRQGYRPLWTIWEVRPAGALR